MGAVGGTPACACLSPPLPAPPTTSRQSGRVREDTTAELLSASLVSSSGVSGAEGPVREHIRALAPGMRYAAAYGRQRAICG